MVEYKCDTCKKIFNHKGDYAKHLNRKFPCKQVIIKKNDNVKKNDHDFKCKACDNSYSQKTNLYRHIRRKHQNKSNDDKLIINDQLKDHTIDIVKNTPNNINNSDKTDTNVCINISKKQITQNPNDLNQFESEIIDLECEINDLNQFESEINHLESEKKLICDYCNNIFSTNSNLHRHKRSCKIKKQKDSEKEDIFKKLFGQLNEQNEHLKKLEKKVDNLTIENKELKSISIDKNINNNNCNNTTNNTQNNINNTINIVPFGEEDLSSISDKVYKIILKKGYQSVEHLIKYTHFNKNKPEFHNVYFSNMKDIYGLINNGKKWMLSGKEEIIDTLYDDKKLFLVEKYDEMKGDMEEKFRTKFERFKNDKRKVVEKNAKNDVKLTLYNNRDIPMNTRKNEEMRYLIK
jgi:hypothetical protein